MKESCIPARSYLSDLMVDNQSPRPWPPPSSWASQPSPLSSGLRPTALRHLQPVAQGSCQQCRQSQQRRLPGVTFPAASPSRIPRERSTERSPERAQSTPCCRFPASSKGSPSSHQARPLALRTRAAALSLQVTWPRHPHTQTSERPEDPRPPHSPAEDDLGSALGISRDRNGLLSSETPASTRPKSASTLPTWHEVNHVGAPG